MPNRCLNELSRCTRGLSSLTTTHVPSEDRSMPLDCSHESSHHVHSHHTTSTNKMTRHLQLFQWCAELTTAQINHRVVAVCVSDCMGNNHFGEIHVEVCVELVTWACSPLWFESMDNHKSGFCSRSHGLIRIEWWPAYTLPEETILNRCTLILSCTHTHTHTHTHCTQC